MAATDPAVRTVPVAALALLGAAASAQVLPEDRIDASYHYYDGDGMQVDGPAVLARRRVGDDVSVSASWYVDSISGASIDVVTTASPYSERRTDLGLGVDWVHEDTLVGLVLSSSNEPDYEARTVGVSVSQEIFQGMTTVSLGYVRGFDEVGRVDDADFSESVDRHAFRLGVTQVLSRRLIAEFALETIADEGYLNNPYRQVRYRDPSAPRGFAFEPEVYPSTRTSTAAALRTRLATPWRGALQLDYRHFRDDWDIRAHTTELGYAHEIARGWTLDVGWRWHTQDGADFFSDLFPRRGARNFRGRNKEISAFDSHALRFGITRDFGLPARSILERGALSLGFEKLFFYYEDFRDVTEGGEVGDEPLFDFRATVFHGMVSLWF